MPCDAVSFQTAAIPLPAILQLVAQGDREEVTQALATYLETALGAVTSEYPDRVFVTAADGTASVAWDAANLYVRSYAPALIEPIRTAAIKFFTAQAATILQQKVAGWAAQNTTVTGAERTGAGALVLKVSL